MRVDTMPPKPQRGKPEHHPRQMATPPSHPRAEEDAEAGGGKTPPLHHPRGGGAQQNGGQPMPLEKWLADIRCPALLDPLDTLGAEVPEDMLVLDAEDVQKLEAGLKKVQLKKFRDALEKLRAEADGHLDEGSPLRIIQEQTPPPRSASAISAEGSLGSPRGSPRTPRGISLRDASIGVAEELNLDWHGLSLPDIASTARAALQLPPKRAGMLPKDDFAEICLHLGIDTGWEGQDSGKAIETWKGIISSDDIEHRRSALQEVVDAYHPDRWIIGEELGRGGNGVVYVATDSRLKRVALKFCAGQQDKLRREAGLLQRVRHENICGLYVDFPSQDGGLFVMCLEFLPGGTFAEVMKAAPKNRVREFEVTRMAFDVLQALSVMHSQDVIHRDIKPSNIMLTTTLDGQSVFKIIDLGISVMEHGSDVSDTLLTSTTGLAKAIGTPHYMSPEQFTEGMVVDQRTDIWSLGVVMYHALTGVLPFAPSEKENTTKIQHSITSTEPMPVESVLDEVGATSEGISDLIADMLQKDPGKRTQLTTDVMQALVDALANNADEQIFDVFINYRVRPSPSTAPLLVPHMIVPSAARGYFDQRVVLANRCGASRRLRSHFSRSSVQCACAASGSWCIWIRSDCSMARSLTRGL